MIAYKIFEIAVMAGFLLYSLRQILPLFPNAALHIAAWLKAARIPPQLIVPARSLAKADGSCAACHACSGCAADSTNKADVITLHRTTPSRTDPG